MIFILAGHFNFNHICNILYALYAPQSGAKRGHGIHGGRGESKVFDEFYKISRHQIIVNFLVHGLQF